MAMVLQGYVFCVQCGYMLKTRWVQYQNICHRKTCGDTEAKSENVYITRMQQFLCKLCGNVHWRHQSGWCKEFTHCPAVNCPNHLDQLITLSLILPSKASERRSFTRNIFSHRPIPCWTLCERKIENGCDVHIVQRNMHPSARWQCLSYYILKNSISSSINVTSLRAELW